jgi:hypothetical protein
MTHGVVKALRPCGPWRLPPWREPPIKGAERGVRASDGDGGDRDPMWVPIPSSSQLRPISPGRAIALECLRLTRMDRALAEGRDYALFDP